MTDESVPDKLHVAQTGHERAGAVEPSGGAADAPNTAVSGSVSPDLLALVAEHHEPLHRYAYRLTGCHQDAEDLTQQVFLTAQQKLHQLRAAECARAWLYTVVRNLYLKSFARRRPACLADLAGEIDLSSVPEELKVHEVDGERLQQALDQLPDEFKLVTLMFYFEERSYREIAETLGVPVGTVMSRLSRAKSHLRRRLADLAPPAAGAAKRSAIGQSAFGAAPFPTDPGFKQPLIS